MTDMLFRAFLIVFAIVLFHVVPFTSLVGDVAKSFINVSENLNNSAEILKTTKKEKRQWIGIKK